MQAEPAAMKDLWNKRAFGSISIETGYAYFLVAPSGDPDSVYDWGHELWVPIGKDSILVIQDEPLGQLSDYWDPAAVNETMTDTGRLDYVAPEFTGARMMYGKEIFGRLWQMEHSSLPTIVRYRVEYLSEEEAPASERPKYDFPLLAGQDLLKPFRLREPAILHLAQPLVTVEGSTGPRGGLVEQVAEPTDESVGPTPAPVAAGADYH